MRDGAGESGVDDLMYSVKGSVKLCRMLHTTATHRGQHIEI